MSPTEPAGAAAGVTRRQVSNLHEGLLRLVTEDHGGEGSILAHRAYQRGGPDGPRPPIAFIDLVVLPPGTSIGRHRHGDDEETYVILTGSGRMTLDGAEFPVRAGDVVRNRPWGEHGLRNDAGTDLHLLVFELGPLGTAEGDPR
ncbi:cupin domain-containing protein [Streptacidiphilus sp. P02-A3a]|uniref:dimethylsulfonioproprionate lyase family protein n=1 Tax=Streptacidiphilus sp. P02-A3a TaxID=2704468 RepID=UPI0015F9CE48|nr:cupin domain-containing protein [Streptacidiphilus sp. P02-A3a]QMU71267.1 cupin domain-containing protein [Streptacidiphilus sp. P02-A3a]